MARKARRGEQPEAAGEAPAPATGAAPGTATGTAPKRGAKTARRGGADRGAGAKDGPPNPFRRVWWLPVVRGVLLVVLGLLLMIEPLERLDAVRVILGAFIVVDGLLVAVQGLAHRAQIGWTWWLAQAAVNVVFGAVVLAWPGLGETALYYVLVVWVLVFGIVAIVGAAGLVRNRDLGWPWMLTIGIVSTLFGLLLVTRPIAAHDVLALVVIVFGLYAFVAGSVHVVSGFAVRAIAQELTDVRTRAQAAGAEISGGSVLGARGTGVARPASAGRATPTPSPAAAETPTAEPAETPGTTAPFTPDEAPPPSEPAGDDDASRT